MFTPKKSAEAVLQNFTAAAAVLPIPTIGHGKIDDVYELGCELQKKRVECAIMIKAALADEEE